MSHTLPKILQHKVSKGLNIPILGEPCYQRIETASVVSSVGLVGSDFVGVVPSFLQKPGQKISVSQALFCDKKNDKVCFTSPAAGTVREIYRGAKRSFISMVVDVENDISTQACYTPKIAMQSIAKLSKEHVVQTLLTSGQWPLLRMRPFGCIADPKDVPSSLFINAMDTNPLSFGDHMRLVFEDNPERVQAGLLIASILMGDMPIHWVQSSAWKANFSPPPTMQLHHFAGKHPAGLVGTHIHQIDPVGPHKKVWYLSLQGLIALGGLFLDETPYWERIICLGGPCVKKPRLLRTRVGANLRDLLQNELSQEMESCRIISGSVLSGSNATSPERSFLGFYDQQVCVLPETQPREFLGMITPGWGKFSLQNVFLSMVRNTKFFMTACKNGDVRAMVPIGAYEKVMPLDICITPFLRCLLTQNLEKLADMGAWEIVEEDLALCTYVCQSKHNYGPLLRKVLDVLRKEAAE